MFKQLFAKKSLTVLLEEMAGEHRLRRALGPVSLSALGIGAIIGTGIFVLAGLAARNNAGPSLILSFVFAGIACALTALCYAEFAAMAPVAGSAYTYAYVSLGEFVAWIIGWDLVLEYAMAAATVANGWSSYFLKLLGLFKDHAGKVLITVPLWMSMDPFTAAEQHTDYQTAGWLRVASATALLLDAKPGDAPRVLPLSATSGIHRVDKVKVTFTPESLDSIYYKWRETEAPSIKRVQEALEKDLQYDPQVAPAVKLEELHHSFERGYDAYEQTPLVVLGEFHLTVNIIAIAIATVITTILVIGIRESAGFNAVMVLIKVAAVLFVIVVGANHIHPANWIPFMPYGWNGILEGAAVIFFAYIGFDAVSTNAEEAKNPKRDIPIAIFASLTICTLLYIAVAAVITGMIPYPQIPIDAPISGVFEHIGYRVATAIITVGALTGITSVLLVMMLSQPRVLLAMARDGLLPKGFFAAVHPRFRTPHKATILTGVFCAVGSSLFPLESLAKMVNIGTLFAFVVVCSAVWMMRSINPQAVRPFRTPLIGVVAPGGIAMCAVMIYHQGTVTWIRFAVWLAVGMAIYFGYSRRHSVLGKQLRREISLHGVSPAGVLLDDEGST